MTYLDVLALLVGDHDLDDEVLDMRRDGLLADRLDKLAELERQPLLALHLAISRGLTSRAHASCSPSSCQ